MFCRYRHFHILFFFSSLAVTEHLDLILLISLSLFSEFRLYIQRKTCRDQRFPLARVSCLPWLFLFFSPSPQWVLALGLVFSIRDLLRFDIDGPVSVTYPVLMRYAFYNAMRDCSVFFSCQHGREARPYVNSTKQTTPSRTCFGSSKSVQALHCKRGSWIAREE